MMDDAIGLVMIQVVSSLGRSGGKISGEAIGKPIGASIGLLVVVWGGAWVGGEVLMGRRYAGWVRGLRGKFVLQTGVLLGVVLGASYAGASVLFTAFLAGAGVRWWDEGRGLVKVEGGERTERVTGVEVYEKYYRSIVERILRPFFFVGTSFGGGV